MAWDFQQTIAGSAPLVLPETFISSVLMIELTIANQPDTWFKAGWLEALVEIEGMWCLGRRFTLGFSGQLIEVPYLSYRLRFQAVPWSELTNLKIKQLTTPEIQSIMPIYNDLPTALADKPVLDSVPTTYSATAFSATAAANTYRALVGNPSRKTFAATNQGGQPIYLDFDTPTTATKRHVSINAGGTYVCDIPYVGDVFIWSSNANAQSVEMREFIQ
ncbi:MAG: hypothetical protein ACRCXH_12680 [Shewanella sp.]